MARIQNLDHLDRRSSNSPEGTFLKALDERGELRSREPHDPSLIGGHRNAFCSSRFQNSTKPDPSQAKIFKRSALFERKTKIVPEKGSR